LKNVVKIRWKTGMTGITAMFQKLVFTAEEVLYLFPGKSEKNQGNGDIRKS
jgi:hypothetical protein